MDASGANGAIINTVGADSDRNDSVKADDVRDDGEPRVAEG